MVLTPPIHLAVYISTGIDTNTVLIRVEATFRAGQICYKPLKLLDSLRQWTIWFVLAKIIPRPPE